ncbi:MAG TPA: hypothetical protein VF731_01755 [Solirubrobacterales bacterium]
MSAFRERTQDLRARLMEHVPDGDELGEFAAVICNRCGRTLVAGSVEKLEEAVDAIGWQVGDELGDDDLCPDCRR